MVDLLPPPVISMSGLLISTPKADEHGLVVGELDRLQRQRNLHIETYSLRFAVALLYELDYVFPQLVIDDFARQYHGEAGIDFMFDNGDAFPRADVVGIRLSNASTEHLFMKQVDLARNLVCFSSSDGATDVRIASIVWVDSTAGVWQVLLRDDSRALRMLIRSTRCRTTSLTNVAKIAEKVKAGE